MTCGVLVNKLYGTGQGVLALICCLCQFPWRKYAPFKATNVMSLKTRFFRSQLEHIPVVSLCVIEQIKIMTPLEGGNEG